MTRTKSKQSGFSVVEALIVIVVIGLFAVGSWAVYQRTKQSATKTDAASNPNQSTQQTPAPAVAYLTITEWGIKVPLSDAIKDATYIPAATIVDKNGRPAAMWVSTAAIEAKGCTLSNKDRDGGGAIGEIMRIEPGDTDGITGELLTKKFPNGTTVGGYYYAYKSWATSNTCASAADQQAPDAAFAAAVNGQVKPSN